MRRIPAPATAGSASADPRDRLDGAVPSPAFAFLLTLVAVSVLFWLVTFKRTTGFTDPEQVLMETVVTAVRTAVQGGAPSLHSALLAISALGSGWFVALGFAVWGLFMLQRRRLDLAWLTALGTLAFPIEWALKFFTAIPEITLAQLGQALFNVGGIGLDDIADFPAGHALRATVFYGIVAFSLARMTSRRGAGIAAYVAAAVLTLVISLIRIYLGAHFPIDVLGGWTAGLALLSVLVSWHVLRVDERLQSEARARRVAAWQTRPDAPAAAAPVAAPISTAVSTPVAAPSPADAPQAAERRALTRSAPPPSEA